MALSASDVLHRFFRHLEAFNLGVRTGDFTAMFAMYHRDAVFVCPIQCGSSTKD
jgi:hypothetical protein